MYAYSITESLISHTYQSPANREELLNWSASLSPELQTAVREPLLSEWASHDPAAAIAWLDTQGGWSENTRLVESIAWSLPEHNIDLALEVYSSVNQETQMHLSQGIINELYRNNPQSAWNWYEGLPENIGKQASLFGLVMLTAQDNPQQALELANNTIDHANTDMFNQVIQSLFYEYPTAVENWLATASIDERQKSDIRAIIDQSQRDMTGVTMYTYDR